MPIGDLPVADIDHDRVDEDRGVYWLRGPYQACISSMTSSAIRKTVSCETEAS